MTCTKILITVVIVLFFAFLLCGGCSSIRTNKVVIDKQFLYDIEKEFQEEATSSIDKSDVYNHIWENNYCEMIYLVSKGDHKAIDVSILLIGQHEHPTCLFERSEEFTIPTVKSDPNYFWKAMEKMKPDTQFMSLYRLSGKLDKDRLKSFLDSHSEAKRLYDEYYKWVIKSNEGSNE